jgi:hypothetical protein
MKRVGRARVLPGCPAYYFTCLDYRNGVAVVVPAQIVSQHQCALICEISVRVADLTKEIL